MPTQIVPRCQDCDKPLKVEYQKLLRSTVTLHTCKNPACLLCDVTLTDTQFASLTAGQLESYRDMNRSRRVGLHVAGQAVQNA